MSIRLQLVDHQSKALPEGLELTLLANGQELAKGTTDAAGVVSFDVEADGKKGLSVRLDGWPLMQQAAAEMMKRKA